jgi:hypothetical protein
MPAMKVVDPVQPLSEPLAVARPSRAAGHDPLLAALVEASADAAWVFHLAARCCRYDLLAVSVDRRALDHEAAALELERLRHPECRARLGGSLVARLRRLYLQALGAAGLLGESRLAGACAEAERRLLACQEQVLQTDLPAIVARVVRRHHQQTQRSLQTFSTPRSGIHAGRAWPMPMQQPARPVDASASVRHAGRPGAAGSRPRLVQARVVGLPHRRGAYDGVTPVPPLARSEQPEEQQ